MISQDSHIVVSSTPCVIGSGRALPARWLNQPNRPSASCVWIFVCEGYSKCDEVYSKHVTNCYKTSSRAPFRKSFNFFSVGGHYFVSGWSEINVKTVITTCPANLFSCWRFEKSVMTNRSHYAFIPPSLSHK